MLWLYDKAGDTIAHLPEYESLLTTERYREHSEWTGRFPTDAYAALEAAYFASVDDEPEVYLVQAPELVTGKQRFAACGGLSASALLSLRTIEGTKAWSAMKAGAMVADMMSTFTGARVLPISFGTGDTLGSAFSEQRSWGDCGEIAIGLLAAQGLGMRTRFEGKSVKLDVYAPADTGLLLGEGYGDGSTSSRGRNDKKWRNYAYVAGEGEGSARIVEIVDQTSGGERRELYVDARDISRGSLTETQYRALLAARGASKLADHRRVDMATATDLNAALRAGDVVWYDATMWSASFMATEVRTVRERGAVVSRTPTFGEPLGGIAQNLRRITNG